MENVEIPDDFYMIDGNLCHKSCLFIGNKFTNCRLIHIYTELDSDSIDKLRIICDMYDKLEEITYFVDGKFNKLNIIIDLRGITLCGKGYKRFTFKLLDEVLQHLQEKIPECIRLGDIKIALKD